MRALLKERGLSFNQCPVPAGLVCDLSDLVAAGSMTKGQMRRGIEIVMDGLLNGGLTVKPRSEVETEATEMARSIMETTGPS